MVLPAAVLYLAGVSLRLAVRVTPKADRDAVDGWTSDAEGRDILQVRVRATPEDGKANAAVAKLLAKTLGVAKSDVNLKSGATSRVKLFELPGDEDTLRRLKAMGSKGA